MFTTLHELAKKATLMITIAAEGDDQLRVNVTPMPFDTKAKSNLPQPLSLLATPSEFDADFIAALSTWQAPKRSLIQQAQEATGSTAATSTPALPAPKAEAKGEKPARKAKGGKGGDDAKSASASTDGGEQLPAGADEPSASTSTYAALDQGSLQAGDEAAAVPMEAAEQDAVDKFTLDLF